MKTSACNRSPSFKTVNQIYPTQIKVRKSKRDKFSTLIFATVSRKQEPQVAVEPSRSPMTSVGTETAFTPDQLQAFPKKQTSLEVSGQLIRSNLCRSSTTSIYMLSVTDFDPFPRSEFTPAPNADSPRSSRNRLITIVKLKKKLLKKKFRKMKKPEHPRRSLKNLMNT